MSTKEKLTMLRNELRAIPKKDFINLQSANSIRKYYERAIAKCEAKLQAENPFFKPMAL